MSNNEIVHGFDDETNEKLSIELQRKGGTEGCLILGLSGFVDTYNSGNFQQRVQKAIEAGYTRLIFNCSGLSYISSTGIGAFIAILKAIKPKGGDLVLAALRPRVHEMLKLLDFAQFFVITDTLEDAMRYFRGKAAEASGAEIVFPCPVCSQKVKAPQPGRFRCRECKALLTVDGAGNVSLG